MVWINEFHYDNAGADTGEFVEIAAAAGTNLSGWRVVLYNGANGQSYSTLNLSGVVSDQTGTGFGFVNLATPGLQNGNPDGIALVNASNVVVQFLSYGGAMTAANGPAAGMTSVNIGLTEASSEPIGSSLGLTGAGDDYSDFTWAKFSDDTPGAANGGQTLSGVAAPSVSVSDATVTEGDAGTQTLTFTLTRSGGQGAFSVDFATADGTATTAGGDYAASSGAVSFAAGEATKTVTVTINGDTAAEADETVLLNLSNPTGGATIADAQGVGTIVNDDLGPPMISVADISVAEGDAGQTMATFTVVRTGQTGAFSVDYATADGAATAAGGDYAAVSGRLDFGAGEMSKTVTVQVNGDTAGEPNEAFFLNLSNATGGAVIADAQAQATIVNDDLVFTSIHDIQGDSFFSPILAGDGISAFNAVSATQVTVQAVVTAIDANGARQGFFISEEEAQWDADFRTSEGIFVMTRNDSSVGVAMGSGAFAGITVGETVTLTAYVMEYQAFNTNVPRTFLVNPTIVSQSNTNGPLPTLVLDGSAGKAIPNAILSDDNPVYTDAFDDPNDTFDPEHDALDFFETVEGMRVTIPDMVVADGSVSGSDNTVRFKAYSEVHADADQINGRGGYTIAGDPPLSPPDTVDPEDGTIRGGRHLHDGDVNPDIVELDFSEAGRGGTSSFDQLLTMGDKIGDVSGVIDFDFQNLKLFVTDAIDTTQLGGAPVQETLALADDARSLRIATFNVENLDPGDGAARFDAIAEVIADNLDAPDIISIEEIQDNNGEASGGADASTTWELLAQAVSTATGHKYQWVDELPANNAEGGAPNGNIRVGFLYNTERVQLGDLSADATIAERRAYTDRIGDGVRDAGDQIAFSDDMIAGQINGADWTNTRKSLLGEFTFNGQTVYVTANHFPSKGGSGAFYQANQNIDTGAPENRDWAQRNAVADDVYRMLATIAAGDADAKVVAGGDFNDFYFYRPMEVLTGYVNPDGSERMGGARFTNLTVSELAEAERYTYTFDGRSQAIDHIVVDQALADVASYDIVHLNTGYSDRTGGVNPSLSDHDPAVAQFDFRSFGELLKGQAGGDTIDGFGGADTIQGLGGADSLRGGEAADQVDGGADSDTVFGDAGADSLVGGEGADSLAGGKDADHYWGGAGKDVYGFGATSGGADVIHDFKVGEDKIAILEGARIVGVKYQDVDLDGVKDAVITLGGAGEGTVTLLGVSSSGNSWLF